MYESHYTLIQWDNCEIITHLPKSNHMFNSILVPLQSTF